MTDAHSVMAVNARDGVLTFLDVKSAEKGASRTWGVAKPSVDELPKLRQISDLAWGFWNRAHPGGANLDKINKFLVHDIANEDTLKLIKIALKTYKVPEGQQRYTYLPKWPGLVFDIETDEGKAMFGKYTSGSLLNLYPFETQLLTNIMQDLPMDLPQVISLHSTRRNLAEISTSMK
jgi:hypothetical protein